MEIPCQNTPRLKFKTLLIRLQRGQENRLTGRASGAREAKRVTRKRMLAI